MNQEIIDNWLSMLPQGIRETLIEMDRSEHWTVREGDLLFNAAAELAKTLHAVYGSSILVKDRPGFMLLIESLAYLKTTYAMHLLSLLARKQPGLGGDLVVNSHENEHESDECHLMVTRIHVLFKIQALERIFGEDRRKIVLDILKRIHEER